MLRTMAVAAALAVAACSSTRPSGARTSSTVSGEVPDMDRFYAEFWEAALARDPLGATYVGDRRYNDRLPNFLSPQYRAAQLAFERAWLARIRSVDRSGLDRPQRLNYEIFVRDRENAIEAAHYPGELIPINPFYSLPNQLAQLGSGSSAQPFVTLQDYQDWLARAQGIPPLFDQAIANMRRGIAQNVVQPRALMVKLLPQLDALIHDDPEQTLFWRPIEHLPESLSAAQRERLRGAYRELIANTLMPAYRALRAFLADEYLPAARDSVGLSALPDGEAWYAFNVRRMTTTALTPAQIHQIGLDEVARIHARMRRTMAEIGYHGSLQAFFEFLDTDPQFEFGSEAELLAAYENLRQRVEAGAARLFSLQPQAAFEIRPVEPFRARSAAGGSYMRPGADGSRPGIFYVNTYDLPSRKTWDMEDLFLHEAIPGHHLQIAIQQELDGVPAFRRFGGYTAFIEGWGLYAESLGRELGVYEDPYSYFGYLQNELWRAIRLVVDTGMHAKGWTREQVIDYMLDNSAQSRTQAIAEAERYIAIPGQALAYKLGELKFQQLRDRAEAALGEDFEIKAFHTELLEDGALPLDLLEDKIDRWIAAQQAA